MLTTELIRARVVKGAIRPRYVDEDDAQVRALATELTDVFARGVGNTRAALDEAIDAMVGEGIEFVLLRGLAKLLLDRCEFAVDAPVAPVEFRRLVFAAAARVHPVAREPGDAVHTVTRMQVLETAARELGIDAATCEQALYADLQSEQVLRAWEPIAPEALLRRYNVALAQAVLLRARSVTICIGDGDPARLRQLFRIVKFHRLLHTVEGDREAGYTIRLDGPANLFHASTRYGLQLALFLPGLLLASRWSLVADVLWRGRRALAFHVRDTDGLKSHARDTGVYVTGEEQHLVHAMSKRGGAWELERRAQIVDLGGEGVLVPNFVVRNRDDGREAYLEIVGYWRRSWLLARMDVLSRRGPPNLILAVSQRLRGETDDGETLPGEVFFYRDVLPVREILARAERVAVRPDDRAISPVGSPTEKPLVAELLETDETGLHVSRKQTK